ncbi:hypothetical protein IJD15_02795 [bacterium]|nr:hypothetical protein [bacterium]
MAANKKKEQPISLRFLFIFTAFIIAFFVYAATPNDIKKIKQSKTFEEMLEYTNDTVSNKKVVEETTSNSFQKAPEVIQTTQQQTYYYQTVPSYEKKRKINYKDDSTFLELLDALRKQPAMSTTSAEVIVKEILKYKGFPEHSINVVIEDENAKQKTQGSYVAAYFNISSGNLHVNKEVLYKTSIEQTIAIIAHELDHFEKNAQICKSMGTDSYAKLLIDNKTLGLNVSFWDNAQKYADISNFDAKHYQDALVRYLSQGSIDLTSSYSDLYRLAEHIRNPMELSAYEVSDFIFDYYGVENDDGPLKKLVDKFNTLDWTIHNLVAKDSLLRDERIAFFDYFFIQAILSTYPQYKDKYNNCLESGNMTEFWLAFEKDHESFYNKNMQLDEKTYNSIFNLIVKTDAIAKQGINNDIICSALKFKINTLLANIVFPNAIKFIKEAANDYLSFIQQNNIYSPKDELNTILTLICIENNITTKNQEEISLYYIKLPKEIESLYGIKGKNRRYHFIYKNEAFQNLLKEKKAENTNITDQQLLSDLLNSKKLNDRNKY